MPGLRQRLLLCVIVGRGPEGPCAAKKAENGPLRRPRTVPDNQARKSVHRDGLIMGPAADGRKGAAIAVWFFGDLYDLILRKTERLFRAGELIAPSQQRGEGTDPPAVRRNNTIGL